LPSRPQQMARPDASSGQSSETSQPPPTVLLHRTPQEREQASRVARRIILDVVVTDQSGKPVSGLQKTAFSLLDNNQPQPIVSFKEVDGRSANPPPHIIFMLDILNGSFEEVAYQVKAVKKYLEQDKGQLSFPTSIAVLSEAGINSGHASRDRAALIGQLKKVQMPLPTLGFPEGYNAQRFHQSVQSLTHLVVEQEDVPGRVLLIWMGPGWPMLSDGPYPGTPRDKRDFFGEILNLSAGFLDAQMTIDTISSPSMMRDSERPRAYYKPFLQGAQKVDQADPADLALPVLAYQSGGLVLEDDKALEAGIAGCISDLDSYYVLAFDSLRSSQDNEYHALRITLDEPKLSARTNASYYARP